MARARPSGSHGMLVRVYGGMPAWLRSLAIRLLKPTYPIAVVVVVFNARQEFLRLRHTYRDPAWRLPGGLVERGEDVAVAAAREVYEEASCVVRVLRIVDAVATGPSFDVAIVAELMEERPFVPNAETDAREWIGMARAGELPDVQERFVRAAWAVLYA